MSTKTDPYKIIKKEISQLKKSKDKTQTAEDDNFYAGMIKGMRKAVRIFKEADKIKEK